jgi:hypothetical protein
MCWGNPWQLADTAQWQATYESLDIFKFYIGDINSSVDTALASSLISALLENDIKIAVELGGLLDWYAANPDSSSEYSFQNDYNKLTFIMNMIKQIDSTKNIDIIEMDGPIRRMLYPSSPNTTNHNIQTAVRELVEVLSLWKDSIPGLKINLLTNFPNWAWGNTPAYMNMASGSNGYGHYDSILWEINTQLIPANVNFDGITIDNPYPYAMGLITSNQPSVIQNVDWFQRIRELTDEAHGFGWDVNMIFNTTNGAQTAQAYSEQTLEYISLFHDSVGICPEGYWIQSWYALPGDWLPETTPYTMTNLTLQVFDSVCTTPLSIEESNPIEFQNLNIYPNPAKQVLNVELIVEKTGVYKGEIYNVHGNRVFLENINCRANNAQYLKIDLKSQAKGIYFFKLSRNGEAITRKFIIID